MSYMLQALQRDIGKVCLNIIFNEYSDLAIGYKTMATANAAAEMFDRKLEGVD